MAFCCAVEPSEFSEPFAQSPDVCGALDSLPAADWSGAPALLSDPHAESVIAEAASRPVSSARRLRPVGSPIDGSPSYVGCPLSLATLRTDSDRLLIWR